MNRFKILVILLSWAVACIAASKGSDSIIGIWRFIKSESSVPTYRNPTGELEMQFAEGGIITVKMRDLDNGGPITQTMKGKFTLAPPDQVTISLDGTTQERYRYRFKDGQLRMEHMDYPVTNSLKRLERFSF